MQISPVFHSSKNMSKPKLHDDPGLSLFPLIYSFFSSSSFFVSLFFLITSAANTRAGLVSVDLGP